MNENIKKYINTTNSFSPNTTIFSDKPTLVISNGNYGNFNEALQEIENDYEKRTIDSIKNNNKSNEVVVNSSESKVEVNPPLEKKSLMQVQLEKISDKRQNDKINLMKLFFKKNEDFNFTLNDKNELELKEKVNEKEKENKDSRKSIFNFENNKKEKEKEKEKEKTSATIFTKKKIKKITPNYSNPEFFTNEKENPNNAIVFQNQDLNNNEEFETKPPKIERRKLSYFQIHKEWDVDGFRIRRGIERKEYDNKFKSEVFLSKSIFYRREEKKEIRKKILHSDYKDVEEMMSQQEEERLNKSELLPVKKVNDFLLQDAIEANNIEFKRSMIESEYEKLKKLNEENKKQVEIKDKENEKEKVLFPSVTSRKTSKTENQKLKIKPLIIENEKTFTLDCKFDKLKQAFQNSLKLNQKALFKVKESKDKDKETLSSSKVFITNNEKKVKENTEDLKENTLEEDKKERKSEIQKIYNRIQQIKKENFLNKTSKKEDLILNNDSLSNKINSNTTTNKSKLIFSNFKSPLMANIQQKTPVKIGSYDFNTLIHPAHLNSERNLNHSNVVSNYSTIIAKSVNQTNIGNNTNRNLHQLIKIKNNSVSASDFISTPNSKSINFNSQFSEYDLLINREREKQKSHNFNFSFGGDSSTSVSTHVKKNLDLISSANSNLQAHNSKEFFKILSSISKKPINKLSDEDILYLKYLKFNPKIKTNFANLKSKNKVMIYKKDE